MNPDLYPGNCCIPIAAGMGEIEARGNGECDAQYKDKRASLLYFLEEFSPVPETFK